MNVVDEVSFKCGNNLYGIKGLIRHDEKIYLNILVVKKILGLKMFEEDERIEVK